MDPYSAGRRGGSGSDESDVMQQVSGDLLLLLLISQALTCLACSSFNTPSYQSSLAWMRSWMLLSVLCLYLSDHTLLLHLLHTQAPHTCIAASLQRADALLLTEMPYTVQVQATLRMQYIQEFYQVTSQ
jgi:hypothetical protein